MLVLTGVRRCGKSVLMQQIRAKRAEKDYFISFDDDRLLHFTVEDFQLLYDVFVEDFGLQHTFYFDEIQMVDRLNDTASVPFRLLPVWGRRNTAVFIRC